MTLAAPLPMERWRRRSRRVRLARKLLPMAIVAIVLGMAGWVIGRALLPGRLIGEVAAVRMLNPRFFGRDDQDQAFLIGAIEALRDDNDDDRAVLDQPFITLGAARVGARTAVYRKDAGRLVLQGGVVFDDGKGGRITTDEAVVDTRAGVVTGQPRVTGGGVRAEGSFGHIQAGSYAIYDQGRRVVFKGGVKARIKGKNG